MKKYDCQWEDEPLKLSTFNKKSAKNMLIEVINDSLSLNTLGLRFGLRPDQFFKLYALIDKHGLYAKSERQHFVKTLFIQPDQHVPVHDRELWSIQMQYLKENVPDVFVNLGDFEDCLALSAWEKNKRSPMDEGLRKRELKEVRKRKDEIEGILDGRSTLVIHEGNHEDRARRWIQDGNIKLKGLVEMFDVMDWDNWRVHPYKRISHIANIGFTHDISMGKYSSFKAVDKLLSNICYGHTHTYQVFSRSSGMDGTYKGITFGCGIDINEARRMYLGENNPSSWVFGFGEITADILSGSFSHSFFEFDKGVVSAKRKIWSA